MMTEMMNGASLNEAVSVSHESFIYAEPRHYMNRSIKLEVAGLLETLMKDKYLE